ncbi:MAG: dihydropyrimidinase, partial [Cyanobacteria bacterium J06638_22]
LTNTMLHHDVDYTPYEGMEIKGYPAITLSRGEVVWRDGEILVTEGRGQFLPCDRSPFAQPKVRIG